MLVRRLCLLLWVPLGAVCEVQGLLAVHDWLQRPRLIARRFSVAAAALSSLAMAVPVAYVNWVLGLAKTDLKTALLVLWLVSTVVVKLETLLSRRAHFEVLCSMMRE